VLASWPEWPARWLIRPILGFCFWGSNVPKKCVIPCLGRRCTGVQNLPLLAVFSAKKSVTVQTRTKKTVTDISTICLSACVDNKSYKKSTRNTQQIEAMEFQHLSFLPRDAMLARYMLSSYVCPSVCLSVCPSHAGIVLYCTCL